MMLLAINLNGIVVEVVQLFVLYLVDHFEKLVDSSEYTGLVMTSQSRRMTYCIFSHFCLFLRGGLDKTNFRLSD